MFMNKILVEVSVGELLDKISILEIKKIKINDPEKLKYINDEHVILKEQLDQNVKSSDKLKDLFQSTKQWTHHRRRLDSFNICTTRETKFE